VASIRVLVHDPQGLYERERALHAYLEPRDDMRPAAFVEAVAATPQRGEIPPQGLLAIGESEIVRPLAWRALLDVEPLARVGRTRIYRTSP
jgi:hypothetical protein